MQIMSIKSLLNLLKLNKELTKYFVKNKFHTWRFDCNIHKYAFSEYIFS
jgi:hypothetical protein